MAGTFSPSVITPGAFGSGSIPSFISGNGAVYLICLNSSGTGLVFGAYFGGNGFNGSVATSLALSAQGSVFVAGFTAESNIPTTNNALQAQYSNPVAGIPCCSNGFILEVDPTGSQLMYGTYVGQQYSGTTITSLSVAPDSSVYFTGTTNTTTQATPGAYLSVPKAPSSGFIAKLTLGSSGLDSFSYLPSFPESPVGPSPFGVPPLVAIGNQPEMAYTVFAPYSTPGTVTTAELTVPSLSLGSSDSLGFVPTGLALAAPHSVWLVGFAGPGALSSVISSGSFQAAPQNPNGGAVLVQLTDASMSVSSVVSGASFASGPVSPGEIVTIAGVDIGPVTPATLMLDASGKVGTSLGGVEVTFNGTLAPLTYVSATQINAVVPYEVQGLVNPYLQISFQGQTTSATTLTVASAAPAIFTANGSGTGPAAALNQDGSYNSPANPAPKGSYVVIYATGEGQTAPSGVTGKLTTLSAAPPLTPEPLLPVDVLIMGQPAFVSFYGEAPSLVSGVMQVNVQIPTNAPSGNLPIVLSVGGNLSQNGVTVSVR
jgi:uncharacterized protein (TIGR03437 family)